jgi:methionine synthase II (cobalamin-independent)
MARPDFNCLTTSIGSLPLTDAQAACDMVWRYFPEIPAWPMLPQRSFREHLSVQFSEGFPGLVIESNENHRIYVDRSKDLEPALERLYQAYLDQDIDRYPTTADYAAGLDCFLKSRVSTAWAVKGHIVGPITWGLTVTDDQKQPLIYDETLSDAAAKMLRLRVAWQERSLARLSPRTIIFLDEPALASLGSAFFNVSSDTVTRFLEEVLGGIRGWKGIHCCGNTDWALLLRTGIDILSFDAYKDGPSLALYPKDVARFLDRGGAIAWGIVPNTTETLASETATTLKDRLLETMAPFTRHNFSLRQLITQSLLTPSCGLGATTLDTTRRALEVLGELSREIRKQYV